MGKDHAVRIVDVETRMEASKPLKGHSGYLHGVQYCPLNKAIATSSEDGTIRTWDQRTNPPCTAILEPFKNEKLQRPKLGKWLGDVSINGDWLVTGTYLNIFLINFKLLNKNHMCLRKKLPKYIHIPVFS